MNLLMQALPTIRTTLARRAGPNLGGLLAIGLLALCLTGPARAAEVEANTLAFLGFELIDDQPDPERLPGLRERLAAIDRQMADGLDQRGLYRLRDLAPAQAALQGARDTNEFLHRCNACLGEIGAAAGARLVGVGWVQRVSNLILNVNLAIWDVSDPAGDRQVLTKSVDIRGDNLESWRRGVAYMLRDMVERRERQPRYGL
ncbi:DUF3280 domain-containing protein [Leptothrix sp. BB-4]